MESYLTVKQAATAQFVEKKSRFIGHVMPVQTEAQAVDFVSAIKKEHKDATHNVFAFSLRENNLMRFSDDGEPQGTAGKPILSIIEKEEIVDVAIVVTRYFGGTLLGTGGLVRAYSAGAKQALAQSGIVQMQAGCEISFSIPYPLYDIFQTKLPAYSLRITDTQFAETITLRGEIKQGELGLFQSEMTQLCKGQCTITKHRDFFTFFELHP